MNLADYCPRGRKLYAEFKVLDARWKAPVYKTGDFPKAMYAHQKFMFHVERECAVCKGDAPARPEPVTGPFKKR